MKPIKVAIAMSGGVDSSLVAYLLKKEGYDIIGLTMKQLDYDEDDQSFKKPCCSLEDIYDTKKICRELEAPHYTVNLKEKFKKTIISYFIEEYKKGNTPNPCVMCNREVKLGALIEYAKNLGAQYLATGHYANLANGRLKEGVDRLKDQSYFLSQVKKDDLNHLMFPLGGYTKGEVRELAEKFNIPVKTKADSQGICFIPNNDYKKFLGKHFSENEKAAGDIIDKAGNILGRHNGVHNYTIGQRRGIGVPGDEAYYVIGTDPQKKHLIIGTDKDVFTQEAHCNKINLIEVSKIVDLNNLKCHIKTRVSDIKNIGIIKVVSDDKLRVEFENKVKAVTPGQIAVFYTFDGYVIASGVIC